MIELLDSNTHPQHYPVQVSVYALGASVLEHPP